MLVGPLICDYICEYQTNIKPTLFQSQQSKLDQSNQQYIGTMLQGINATVNNGTCHLYPNRNITLKLSQREIIIQLQSIRLNYCVYKQAYYQDKPLLPALNLKKWVCFSSPRLCVSALSALQRQPIKSRHPCLGWNWHFRGPIRFRLKTMGYHITW